MQKEAYFLKKKCVTLRDETEWTELIELGCNILAGADAGSILSAVDDILSAEPDFSGEIYGNGKSRILIVNYLLNEQ